MLKKLSINVLCFVFALAGLGIASAAEWPDALIKEVEALKAAGKDKKDMPPTIAGVKNITGDEIKKMMDEKKKFVLLDNRLKADYDKEHITGAVLFTVDELLKNPKLANTYKKDDVLINYCNGVKCWRSPAAALLLKHLGFKNIYWYRDGLPDWIKKDYPTTEGKK
ncbi:rhodanese-like domain-containing protein [Dissulfurispira sp.]|uniref:rhodanese-like domain-containing protein n=1 Tax=Dissulfurispira sp. TaxID=2817609 RepID=UPI002FD96DF0